LKFLIDIKVYKRKRAEKRKVYKLEKDPELGKLEKILKWLNKHPIIGFVAVGACGFGLKSYLYLF